MRDLYKIAIDTATIFSETDTTGTIVNVNDLFCTISGYKRHELIGQNHSLISSQIHCPIFFHNIWSTIAKGIVWKGQICNKKKDGELYWVCCTIIPITASEPSYCEENLRTEGECNEPLTILKYVSVSFDITAHTQRIESLQQLASYDSLTGLPNRAFLHEHLERKISSSRRSHQRPFAVCMLDMDNFKRVNDKYGHFVGDRLLIETARRLKANFRQQDVVARVGGDEFIIVWDDADIDLHHASALQYTENYGVERRPGYALLKRVFAGQYDLGDGVILNNIKGSLGVALYPEHGLSVETLLKQADQALLQAKHSGGNCIRVIN